MTGWRSVLTTVLLTTVAVLGGVAAWPLVRTSPPPANSAEAVRLAGSLLKEARVLNQAALPLRAEAVLDEVLEANPSDYFARRMRATVYLTQHRFREALVEAERCRSLRQDDPSIDGIIGDALIELGDLPGALEAIDRMTSRRPDAAAYARASYARELQGDLDAAIELMAMASSATSAHDPEAQAWHAAQLGHLYQAVGQFPSARREYERAGTLFPGHPLAETGLARLDLAMSRPADALTRLNKQLETRPSATDFELAGDAYLKLNRADDADRAYKMAEAMWTSDTPEPAQLARFQAARESRAAAIYSARKRAAAKQ